MMSYGWFVKLCTFISTNTKCTCVLTHGTEVSVCLLMRGSLGPGSGKEEGVVKESLDSLRS